MLVVCLLIANLLLPSMLSNFIIGSTTGFIALSRELDLSPFLEQIVFPELNSKIKFLSIESNLETLLVSAIMVIVGVIVARIAKTILNRLLREKMPKGSRVLIERIVFYSIVVLAGLAALSSLGVDFTGALLAGGIVGIIIGFATQSIVSNLLSGIFLHLDRPLEIGEPVEIEDMAISGVVTDITAFSTRLRKFDGTFVRVPNDKLFTSRIRNFDRYPARRMEIKIGISYKDDVAKAIEIIKSRLDANPLILAEPASDIFLDALSESSVDLSIFAWTAKPVFFQVKKQIIEDIKGSLDKAGIEIPLPQRVIHLQRLTDIDDLDADRSLVEKDKHQQEKIKKKTLDSCNGKSIDSSNEKGSDEGKRGQGDGKQSQITSNSQDRTMDKFSSQGFHEPSGDG
jgi:small-conductance mechanosensitive channel